MAPVPHADELDDGETDDDLLAALAELVDQAFTRYDLTFVCDLDIPFENSWDRSGEVNRVLFHRQLIGDLSERKRPFILLRGGLEERSLRVRNLLARFKKYMNVVDLFEGSAL